MAQHLAIAVLAAGLVAGVGATAQPAYAQLATAQLAPAQLAPASDGPISAPTTGTPAKKVREDDLLWETIRDTGYLELYELFLRKFPTSWYAPDARLTIAILKGEIDPNAPSEEELAAQAVEDAAQNQPELDLDPLNLDVAELQRALRAHGCNGGIDDGIWGDRTTGAAQRFADALGLNVDPSRPNVALFQAVLTADGDVCGEI